MAFIGVFKKTNNQMLQQIERVFGFGDLYFAASYLIADCYSVYFKAGPIFAYGGSKWIDELAWFTVARKIATGRSKNSFEKASFVLIYPS